MPAQSVKPAIGLAELTQGIVPAPSQAIAIRDVTLDSRAVTPGALFLACRGRASHGLKYLVAALGNGASAVLWETAPGVSAPRVPAGVTAIEVPDLSRHVGQIADRFFGNPSAALAVAEIGRAHV